MKKVLFLLIFISLLTSCNSDEEESNLDPIVGTWKITSSKVDGKEIHSTNDCDKDNSITYFYDGSLKDNYSYVNSQNECVNSENIFDWKNLGNSIYKFGDIELKIIFNPGNNVFTETVIIEVFNKDVTVVVTRKRI